MVFGTHCGLGLLDPPWSSYRDLFAFASPGECCGCTVVSTVTSFMHVACTSNDNRSLVRGAGCYRVFGLICKVKFEEVQQTFRRSYTSQDKYHRSVLCCTSSKKGHIITNSDRNIALTLAMWMQEYCSLCSASQHSWKQHILLNHSRVTQLNFINRAYFNGEVTV